MSARAPWSSCPLSGMILGTGTGRCVAPRSEECSRISATCTCSPGSGPNLRTSPANHRKQKGRDRVHKDTKGTAFTPRFEVWPGGGWDLGGGTLNPFSRLPAFFLLPVLLRFLLCLLPRWSCWGCPLVGVWLSLCKLAITAMLSRRCASRLEATPSYHLGRHDSIFPPPARARQEADQHLP